MTNTTTATVHPIEFALAVILATIESVLWLINELAGFHTQTTPTPTATPSQTPRKSAATRLRTQMIADLQGLTKRQLQTLTGLKSSKYNKAALLKIATENLTLA